MENAKLPIEQALDLPLEDLRCRCGKIVSQIKDNTIYIKCRHCKRFIVIETKGITKIEYK